MAQMKAWTSRKQHQGRIRWAVVGLVAASYLGLSTCDLGWAQEPKAGPASGIMSGRIGFVNLAKVFDGYKRTQTSDAVLEQQGKQKEAELEGRVNELKKMRESLELLNAEARESKLRQIEEKSDELQRFRNATARDLKRDRDKIAQEILTDIQKAIEEYAKANGFSLILDERSLLYGQAAYDATDDILKLLNDRFGGAKAPAAAPAPNKPAR